MIIYSFYQLLTFFRMNLSRKKTMRLYHHVKMLFSQNDRTTYFSLIVPLYESEIVVYDIVVDFAVKKYRLKHHLIWGKCVFCYPMVYFHKLQDFLYSLAVEREPIRSLIIIWERPVPLYMQPLLSFDKILFYLPVQHIIY